MMGSKVTEENAELIAKSEGEDYDLRLPRQDAVLINIAHRNQSIHSDGAAFRILGFFKNADKAKKHFDELDMNGTETGIHEAHAWKLISEKPCSSPAEELCRIEEILKSHRAKLKEDKEEFQRRYDAKETFEHEFGSSTPKTPKNGSKNLDSKTPRDVDDVVPRQEFAAVGIVRDDSTYSNDCIVSFMAAFETGKQARKYIRDTAAQEYSDFELFSVRMYEFVYVDTGFDPASGISKGFHHKILDDIWRRRELDDKKAKQYIKKREENGNAITFEEIDSK